MNHLGQTYLNGWTTSLISSSELESELTSIISSSSTTFLGLSTSCLLSSDLFRFLRSFEVFTKPETSSSSEEAGGGVKYTSESESTFLFSGFGLNPEFLFSGLSFNPDLFFSGLGLKQEISDSDPGIVSSELNNLQERHLKGL